jgi:cardiolipin synthase
MPKLLFNIPNLLSFYRIAVVPVLFVLFFFDNEFATWINVFFFFWACISDYLDGVIARKTGQSSVFGKFLDHTSDKILIGGVLLLLVAFHRLEGIWIFLALIIFAREIFVAGLREFLGQYKVDVPISWMGKWKTAVQMFASGFLIAGSYGDALIPHAYAIGKFAFLIATVMTVASGWAYLKAGLETLKKLDAEKTV